MIVKPPPPGGARKNEIDLVNFRLSIMAHAIS